MKRRVTIFLSHFLLAACLINTPTAVASPPVHLWSQRFGSTGDDNGRSVALDASGGMLVTGTFRGTVDFGGGNRVSAGGSNDIFVAKYNASGVHQWSQRFGSTNFDAGNSVAVDGSGNVFVTGAFQGTVDFGGGSRVSAGGSDIFLAKYSSTGVHQWSQRFGSTSSDVGAMIAVDGSGNVFVTGYFVGTLNFGGSDLVSAGEWDIFLAKYDASGTHVWSQRFGSTNFDVGHAVAVDGSGNVLMTGRFDGTVDFGGGNLVSAGAGDIFVVKYDASGGYVWSWHFGGMDPDEGFSVAVDGAGNVLMTGHFYGTVDFGGGNLSAGASDIFLAKYDASGTHLWSQRFGSTGADFGDTVAADGAGNVFVTGSFEGTVDFGGGNRVSAGSSDIFVAKYDASGTHVWSQRFGSAAYDTGESVGADGSGNAFVTGGFFGIVDFGGGELVSAGDSDIFLAKYTDSEVAVAITSFEAEARDGVVELRAAFRSDLGVEAVNVYRGGEESSLSLVATVTDVGRERFEYLDRDVTPGTTYRYKIGIVDGDGEFFSPIVVASVNPLVAQLEQNAPNPFNPGTSISFTISNESRVTLSIYDAGGALVRVLLDAVREHGTYRVEWDGRDDHGTSMSSGVYFYRLQAGKVTESRKMVLIK